MTRVHLLTATLVVGCLLGAGMVSANEAPLVDAGLDQRVQQGSTVYLDAGGSVDPDGNIEKYSWQITAPNGSTIAPDCRSCEQTFFQPLQSGRYEATVTATDDDGLSRSDTLVVEVDSSEPPSVTLSGSTEPTTDGNYIYQATIQPGDVAVSQIHWGRNGSTVEEKKPDRTVATERRAFSFEETGAETISATVIDAIGQTDRATIELSVTSGDGMAAAGTSGFYEEIERFNTNDGVMLAFNFLNDDQLASNKNAGSSGPGGDAGGYGVRRGTLQKMSFGNPNVTLSDGGGGETTYQITGSVAQNFIENNETVFSGTRVGTGDILTESDLLNSTEGDNDTQQWTASSNSTDQRSTTDGTSEPSTETGTEGSDENRGTVDDTDSSQESGSSDDGLGENSAQDDGRNCLGWECLEPGDSDVSDDAENPSQTGGRSNDTGGSESTGLLA